MSLMDTASGDPEMSERLVRLMAEQAVAAAKALGMVVTIEQRSIPPLAMGRYETVVSVRPARDAS